MKELYFVRHGETEWNAEGRVQGQWNSDLNSLGREQADINGRMLARLGVAAIVASPLDRTRQTAEIITRHVNLPVHHDERIVEWDCGDWSGHLYNEVAEKWPEHWKAWREDRYHYRGPNCENIPDMIERTAPFIAELLSRPEPSIAIVSHGTVGKIMVAQLLQLDEAATLALHQANDTVYRITLANDVVEAAHFVGGEGPHPGTGS